MQDLLDNTLDRDRELVAILRRLDALRDAAREMGDALAIERGADALERALLDRVA